MKKKQKCAYFDNELSSFVEYDSNITQNTQNGKQISSEDQLDEVEAVKELSVIEQKAIDRKVRLLNNMDWLA